MGTALILLFFGIVGLTLAGVAALSLRWVVVRFTRDGRNNARLMRAATWLPVACLAWAGTLFVLQAVVDVRLSPRDIGIGDGFDCPLPNGYALSFIDDTDVCTLYEPKGHPLWDGVQENAI